MSTMYIWTIYPVCGYIFYVSPKIYYLIHLKATATIVCIHGLVIWKKSLLLASTDIYKIESNQSRILYTKALSGSVFKNLNFTRMTCDC